MANDALQSIPRPLLLREEPRLPSPFAPLGGADGEGSLLALQVSRAWTSEVLGGLAPGLLAAGSSLFCVDGGNSFDPYAFSTFARRAAREERDLLRRVRVTRAFTIHQLEAAAREMLEPLAALRPRPFVALLGLDHLFLEETLPLAERRRVLARVLASLHRMREAGLSIVATHDPPLDGRGWWKPLVDAQADAHGTVTREDTGGTRLHLRRPGGRGSPFGGLPR